MQQPPPYPGDEGQKPFPPYPPNAQGGVYPPPPVYYPPQQYPGMGYPQQTGMGYPQQPGMGYPQQQTVYPEQAGFPQTNYNSAEMPKESYAYVGSDEPAPGMGLGFSDQAVRRGFIRKVYGILMCQLVVTAAIIATFMFVHPVKMYVQRNMWVYWTSFGVMFVCLISLACCESVRRKSPTNFIFLGLFTMCEGVMLGTLATFYDVDAVLIAVGITAGVSLALTLFAFQTKWDFTACGGMLCAVLVIFIFAGIIMAILPQNKWTMIGYGSLGALIFSLYLVYDTQLMLGGKHKYSLSPEEYVFASLNLYLDVINIFLYILMIVGASKSN